MELTNLPAEGIVVLVFFLIFLLVVFLIIIVIVSVKIIFSAIIANKEPKQMTFLSRGQKSEVNIVHPRTVVSPKFPK